MEDSRFLLFVRIPEVPPTIEAAWNRWYDADHLPRRLEFPGFAAARRFRAVWGEYRYLTLYELSSLDALTHPSYLALRARDAAMPPERFASVTPRLPGFARGVYEQITPGDRGYRVPQTPALFAVGHDVPDVHEAEFNAWYDTEHLPTMLERVPGFVTGRRFRLVDPVPAGATGVYTPGPRYLAVYDLADTGVLETETFKRETVSPWSTWVRSWYTRRLRILASRLPS